MNCFVLKYEFQIEFTCLTKVIGGCSSCWGLPMLQKINVSKGNFLPSAKSCCNYIIKNIKENKSRWIWWYWKGVLEKNKLLIHWHERRRRHERRISFRVLFHWCFQVLLALLLFFQKICFFKMDKVRFLVFFVEI